MVEAESKIKLNSPDGSSGLLGGVGGGVTGISTPTEKRTDRIKAVISISTHHGGFLQRVNAFDTSALRLMCVRVSMDQDNVRDWLLW